MFSHLFLQINSVLFLGDGYQEYSLFLSAGLIYVLILYLSLIQKPNVLSLVAVAGLLGVTNFFVLYSNPVLILFPVEFTHYIVFVVPSLMGAVATLLCIKYIWEINITLVHVRIVLLCIFVTASTTSILHAKFGFQSIAEFAAIINSLAWWNAFTVSILWMAGFLCF